MQQKKFFHSENEKQNDCETLQNKREFHSQTVVVDEQAYYTDSIGENDLHATLQSPLSWWQRGFIGITLFFFVAVVAQAIQWLIDAWLQHQWINFAFALVFSGIVALGLTTIVNEFRHLRQLKRLEQLQQRNKSIQLASPTQELSAKTGSKLTQQLIEYMRISPRDPQYQQWQHYANQGYSAAELLQLFSQEFLSPLDQQAKKLINKQAIEATMLVAISPLALVDMAFIAWRHLRLINQLAKLYGMKLGYFSRISLIKMVLFNIAFAGATEVIREIGMDWLSQDITAKLSARVAQGIGVGLLTARLGLKTLELCRPVPFTVQERPKLHTIHKLLLEEVKSIVKDNLFRNKQNEFEK
ncbi:YcjF family protein [Gallibacterium trehalosifermentans]|uniref:UPF0283 membrane protein ACFFHK_08910 n=1 Tax=Gallibacterium trehalosifermentans TaxID=516935 RepID=A0ABV6H2G4_9PAST